MAELKTQAQRQREYEIRMRDGGYSRLCFWVHTDDAQSVKDAVNNIIYQEKNDEQNSTS